jgi:hypothetical protein
MYEDEKVTYFGETDFRNQKTKFGIKQKDRSRHVYVIGKTGMGKSTLLENLAIQDIQNDQGLIFIDPHGSSAVKLLDYVPRHRVDDVIYFAPHDADFPIAFNVLEQVPREKRNAVAGGLLSAFKKIWVDSFSSRMEYLLNYTLLALLDVPGSTLLSVNRLLSDKVYRKYILERVEDTLVKSFWTNEFDKYSTSYANEAVAPIQNKVGQFIASPMIRNIVGQDVSTIDFRACMDQKKIVIINISKGIIGPENMRLLGGMLITKIQLAAMSRANLDYDALKRAAYSHLYVDEFQNFANESFAEILSESRKYKLCLTVANQYIDQMTEEVRNAVIGNVGTFISYRVGSTDAEIMEKEFAPAFTEEDMVNLGFTQMYLKLMIDGIGSKPFSARGLPPIPKPEKSYVAEIIGYSRKYFSRPRAEIEDKINKWNNKDFNLELEKNKQSKKEESSKGEKKPDQKKEGDTVEQKNQNNNSQNGQNKKEEKKPEKQNGQNGNTNASQNGGQNSEKRNQDQKPQNKNQGQTNTSSQTNQQRPENKNTQNQNTEKKENLSLKNEPKHDENRSKEKADFLKAIQKRKQALAKAKNFFTKSDTQPTKKQNQDYTKTKTDLELVDEIPEDVLEELLRL